MTKNTEIDSAKILELKTITEWRRVELKDISNCSKELAEENNKWMKRLNMET